MRRACLAVVIALGIAGCGGSASHSSSSQSTSTGTASATSSTASSTTGAAPSGGTAPAACRAVPVPAPKAPQHLPAPNVKLDPSRTYIVTVLTNCGTFAFALDVKHAPKTSASVYYLVKRGFYDGLTFHRVASGFVIQGGDPLGNGTGGPGYAVVEAPPANTQYLRGDVAMAKTQTDPPGASGSQFFIVTAPNITQSAQLPPDYALAGRVVTGIGVVEKIGALPTNPPGDGAPSPAVVMSKVTVSSR
jgi:cyclophilin family peptidyl-prolyl cis-trans isomerase